MKLRKREILLIIVVRHQFYFVYTHFYSPPPECHRYLPVNICFRHNVNVICYWYNRSFLSFVLHLHWSVAFILVGVCDCRLLPYHMSYASSLEMTELRNFLAEIQSLFVNKGFVCDGCKFQLLLSVNKARYGTSFFHSQYHILRDYSLLLASRYILSLLCTYKLTSKWSTR